MCADKYKYETSGTLVYKLKDTGSTKIVDGVTVPVTENEISFNVVVGKGMFLNTLYAESMASKIARILNDELDKAETYIHKGIVCIGEASPVPVKYRYIAEDTIECLDNTGRVFETHYKSLSA